MGHYQRLPQSDPILHAGSPHPTYVRYVFSIAFKRHTFNRHSTTRRTSSFPLGDMKSQGYRSCDVRVICDLIFDAAAFAASTKGEVSGIKGRVGEAGRFGFGKISWI